MGECLPYMQEVIGSNPLSCTIRLYSIMEVQLPSKQSSVSSSLTRGSGLFGGVLRVIVNHPLRNLDR